MYCPYRQQGVIICEDVQRKCEGCGWHPKEEAKRKEDLLRELKRGYCHGTKIRIAL